MLTALEEGVKGGVWFSLIDKVWTERNLRSSYSRVAAKRGAAGVDHVTVEGFERDLDRNVANLAKALQEGSYHPSVIRRTYQG
jgi:RNA-directed DNA polymerase